ncbi:MAG TPA: 4'-phosphopantetheinyl transferase superfamily protein [Acidimicrobiales bacterium]
MTPPGTLRVGMDLVSIDEVAASVRHFGDRYVTRVYTPHEIDSCRGRPGATDGSGGLVVESLAARFAAKEAVMKVLRPVDVQLDWRSIELHRMKGGWCEIRLSGRAAAMAAEAGIDELSVSLTHEAAVAGAVVVGRCTSRERGDG